MCLSPVTPSWCVFHHPEEERPVVTNITISDVSWDSFLLSWSAEDGAFEAFLIEITDAETGAEWQNHTVSADARSLAISGLSPTTWYRVILYGVYRGILLDPVFAETITGISAINAGASLFSFLIASSSSSAHTLNRVFPRSLLHAGPWSVVERSCGVTVKRFIDWQVLFLESRTLIGCSRGSADFINTTTKSYRAKLEATIKVNLAFVVSWCDNSSWWCTRGNGALFCAFSVEIFQGSKLFTFNIGIYFHKGVFKDNLPISPGALQGKHNLLVIQTVCRIQIPKQNPLICHLSCIYPSLWCTVVKWTNILSTTHKTHLIYIPAAELCLIRLYLSVCPSRNSTWSVMWTGRKT